MTPPDPLQYADKAAVRPRLLDLFCGAGGAAMGYHRAGFDVFGVDIEPQPNYPFDFHQGDAMTWPLDGFDAIHASPPCQHYANVTRWRGEQSDHPDLLPAMVERLEASGVPWIVENVPDSPMVPDFVLCGSMFGLRVRRHRWFLTSWAGFELVPPCRHNNLLPFMHKGERAYADAMGCDWMTNREARQAIPPDYTQWLALILRQVVPGGPPRVAGVPGVIAERQVNSRPAPRRPLCVTGRAPGRVGLLVGGLGLFAFHEPSMPAAKTTHIDGTSET